MIKWFCIASVCLPLLSGGCIKASPVLTIKNNGSGRLDLNYSVSEASINQYKAMLKLRQQMALASGTSLPDSTTDFISLMMDPDEAQFKAVAEKYRNLGIALDWIKIQSRNAWRSVELKVSFSDIKKLELADFFTANGFSLSKRHDGNYVLYKPAVRQKDQGVKTTESELAFLAPLMGGFMVNVRFEFPGRLIDTNGHSKGLYNAQWHFDFDKDQEALTRLQQQDFRVIFDGKGLSIPEVILPQQPTVMPPAKKTGTPAPGAAGMPDQPTPAGIS